MRIGRKDVICTAVTGFLLMSGCGGDSGSGQGESKDLGTLKVLDSVGGVSMPQIGVKAALTLGVWDDTGLTVDRTSGEEAARAMASGDIDVAVASPNRFTSPIKKGLEATMVGSNIPWWDMYVIVPEGSKAREPADLKGATFAITSHGSAGDYATAKLAQSLGWSKDDYKTVALGGKSEVLAGLQSGAADAVLWNPILGYTLEAKGLGRMMDEGVREKIGPAPLNVVVVRDQAIEERPKAVRTFCKGYYSGIQKLQSDPQRLVQILVEEGNYKREVAKKTAKAQVELLATSPKMTREMMKGIVDATKATVSDMDSLTVDDVAGMYTNCYDIGSG